MSRTKFGYGLALLVVGFIQIAGGPISPPVLLGLGFAFALWGIHAE